MCQEGYNTFFGITILSTQMTWILLIHVFEWANIHMRQISADCNTKKYGHKEELLVIQDNLDDQVLKIPRYLSGGI